jgi:hypothetical protein
LRFLSRCSCNWIRLPGAAQRLDRNIEIAVLLTQPLDLPDQGGAFVRRQLLLIHRQAALPQSSARDGPKGLKLPRNVDAGARI